MNDAFLNLARLHQSLKPNDGRSLEEIAAEYRQMQQKSPLGRAVQVVTSLENKALVLGSDSED